MPLLLYSKEKKKQLCRSLCFLINWTKCSTLSWSVYCIKEFFLLKSMALMLLYTSFWNHVKFSCWKLWALNFVKQVPVLGLSLFSCLFERVFSKKYDYSQRFIIIFMQQKAYRRHSVVVVTNKIFNEIVGSTFSFAVLPSKPFHGR